jgi:leucyl-tRNA synthetase
MLTGFADRASQATAVPPRPPSSTADRTNPTSEDRASGTVGRRALDLRAKDRCDQDLPALARGRARVPPGGSLAPSTRRHLLHKELMAGYQHSIIDAKWQAFWDREQTFKTPTDRTRPKYYVLDMFPYPSGDGLHVGHPKGYSATDVVARAKRMLGFNVLHTMGWDSFGLPAERRAERTGEHPAVITARNIAIFKNQLQKLGLSYDWTRELATSDPRFYRWTQWIFELLFERGLAYRAEVAVNFCPALVTVLANEEVHDGKYVETGDPVEKRLMSQWLLRITEYADRLAEELEGLDWPAGTYKAQLDWIGKSIGANVMFKVVGSAESITVFTTRPDTLFGGTWVVLAPEHALVDAITTPEQRRVVSAYREQVGKRSERDRITEAADAPKTGVPTGAFAINPVNGKHIPIWIADYVLASYGTGAVFACPAGDERDHAFARKFGLPIVEVVAGPPNTDVQVAAYTGDGPHVNSGFLDGLDNEGAKTRVIAWLAERGLGEPSVRYKLRDWLFSRQRYWGEPIPMIELADGTMKPVPRAELPVELPQIDEYRATPDGKPPLARATDWLLTVDAQTGLPARRETNTMPQWAGSCWYYLRFLSPDRDDVAWDPEEDRYWMPVDLYVGGSEHATLHLLYARFWHKVLHDAGLVSTKEPFQRLVHQGMIHKTSFRDLHGKYHHEHEVEQRDQLASRTESFTGSYLDSKGAWILLQQDSHQVIGTGRFGNDQIKLTGEASAPDTIIGIAKTEVSTTAFSLRRTSGTIVQFESGGKQTELVLRPTAWFVKGQPLVLETKLDKMSKSRLNVVNPDDMCAEFGADAMRLYELFMGPLEDGIEWDTTGVSGTRRFLDRVWRLLVDPETDGLTGKIRIDAPTDNRVLERALHAAIKKVTQSIDDLRFNTAIAEMMMFVNEATKATAMPRAWFEMFVKILSPFAPHLAEELWQRLGHTDTIAFEPWPLHEEAKLARDVIQIAVQVSGKLRAQIEVAPDASEAEVLAAAQADPKVRSFVADNPVKKAIYVKGRLVNLVV